MPDYALFFRGINIGKRRMAMADLRGLLADVGGEGVATVLQSGSATMRHAAESASELEALVESALVSRFGYASATHARTLAELDKIVAANPFQEFADERPNHLLVSFAKGPFDQSLVKSVQDLVTGPELLGAVGRELFVIFPDGIGPSTLPKVKGYSTLVGSATARNWNTCLKVREALQRLG